MARITKLVSDPSLLEAALEGLEAQRYRIEGQIQQVRRLLGKRSNTNGSHEAAAPTVKRQLSSAARKRIAAAQKKRWAAYRRSAAEK